MIASKETFFAISASWLSRFLTIALGIALMPVLFKHLEKEELGVWVLLSQTSAILGVLDFGFAATLTRRIALSKGRSGSYPGVELNEESVRLIAELVATGRRVYQVIAIATFTISFLSGVAYLLSLGVSNVNSTKLVLAWAILCFSHAVNVFSSIWTSLLQGIGYVGWDSLISSLTSSLAMIAQIGCVYMGGGIISLAVVVSMAALAQRCLVLYTARVRRPQVFALTGAWSTPLFKGMIGVSLRSWITGMVWAVMLSADAIFIAKILGAESVPVYRAAHLIFFNLATLSVTAGAASSVFVSQLWQSGARQDVRGVVLRNLRLGLGLMAAGGAFVVALDHNLFFLWLGSGKFVGSRTLWVLFAVFLCEVQVQIITFGSRATEDEAFAISSMIAGGLKVFFAIVFGNYFGLIGIALSTLVAQGLTNYWYMVYRGLTRLEIAFRDYILSVLLPVILLFFGVLSVVTCLLSSDLLEGVQELMAAAGLSGMIMALFCWACILNHHQRQRLFKWLNSVSFS